MPRPPARTGGRVDALVTDGGARPAVAAVRALAAAGLRVLVTASSRGAAGWWSRHAAARALLPPPADPGFAAELAELAGRSGPLVVHPGEEEALAPLHAARDALPAGVVLAFGDPTRLRDKRCLADAAGQAGLRTPAVLAEGTAAAVLADPPDEACVVKAPGLSAALPVPRRADGRAAVRAVLASLPPGEPVLVQERLEGPLRAVSLVVDREGRIVAQLQQVSRRLWPPDAGASAVAVTVAPDAALLEGARRLLAGAGFWGLAQLQLLRSADGLVLIDVNPRAYGSLPLAAAAGVNLPAAAQAVALGQALPSPAPYPAGVAFRWLIGDLHAAWRGDRARLRRPAERPLAGAMWAAGDPLPGALLAAEALGGPLVRRVRRR